MGLGAIAPWAQLLAGTNAAAGPTAPARPARRPRRRTSRPRPKRVIYLFMAGGAEPSGTVRPQAASSPSATASCRRPSCSRATAPRSSTRTRSCSGPKFKFAKHGQSRRASSRSCCRTWPRSSTTSPSSSRWSPTPSTTRPAQILMNTGSQQFGRPSFGAWTTYGLGSESQDLPGFVVFSTGKKGTSGGNSQLGQRLSAHGLPGRAVPRPAATRCCISPIPRASTPSSSAIRSTRIQQLNQRAARRRRRPGNRHADQLVRDGLPHADRAPRS